MRLVRLVAPVAVALVLALVLGATAAAQDGVGSGTSASLVSRDGAQVAADARARGARFSDPDGHGDHELFTALEHAGLVDEWLDSSPVSLGAAWLDVDGDHQYEQARAELLAELDRLGAQIVFDAERRERLDRADRFIDSIDQLLHDFRRDVATRAVGPDTSSLHRPETQQVRAALAQLEPWWQTRFSPDSITLVEYRLGVMAIALGRDIDAIGTHGAELGKGATAAVLGRLSRLPGELGTLRQLILDSRTDMIESQDRLIGAQATVVDRMPALHSQRMLAATRIEDLPLVTVDAYLRAAAAASEYCVMDWGLLAGIGQVESFHGTLGDSEVGPSGRVTVSILGPLLDGGATRAEAAEAARQAERAALAAAEAAEADKLESAPPEPAFSSELWGEGPSVSPTPESVGGDSRFDPRLWGEVPSLSIGSDADEAEIDDDQGEAEPDVPIRARGNGFAVIADSDDGRLDGNARWDRAVGPMQFLPETWARFEVDGNGDGVADPQNLYDAAATAARFLCYLKANRGPAPATFVLGYNQSDAYVRKVLAVAAGLASVSFPVVEDAW